MVTKITETHTRTLAKSVTWRVTATLTTILLVFLLTGSLAIATSVGVAEAVLKLLFYYLHDRAWQKVSWGVEEC